MTASNKKSFCNVVLVSKQDRGNLCAMLSWEVSKTKKIFLQWHGTILFHVFHDSCMSYVWTSWFQIAGTNPLISI